MRSTHRVRLTSCAERPLRSFLLPRRLHAPLPKLSGFKRRHSIKASDEEASSGGQPRKWNPFKKNTSKQARCNCTRPPEMSLFVCRRLQRGHCAMPWAIGRTSSPNSTPQTMMAAATAVAQTVAGTGVGIGTAGRTISENLGKSCSNGYQASAKHSRQSSPAPSSYHLHRFHH